MLLGGQFMTHHFAYKPSMPNIDQIHKHFTPKSPQVSGTSGRSIDGTLGSVPPKFDDFLVPAKQELSEFVRSTEGRTATLVGHYGTGKSRLLHNLAEDLKKSFTVRVQTAKPTEHDWPFSGVSAFVAHLDGSERHNLEALLHNPGNADKDRHAVAYKLIALIRNHQNHDRIILIDDFDRLDPASKEILGFTLGRLAGTGLRVVVSVTGSRVPVQLAGTHMVTLSRLSTKQLTDLCELSAETAAEPSTLHMIALTSHGNPAGALSILRRLPSSQIRGVDPLILPFVTGPVPDPDIAACYNGLSEQQRWLLQLLSAVRTTPRRLIEDINVHLPDVLESLEHAGLVGASHSGYHLIKILDSRIRSTTYWAMTPDQRRLVHQQLAEYAENDFPQTALWHRSFLADTYSYAEDLLVVACELAKTRRPIDALEHAERGLVLGAGHSPRFSQLGTSLAFELMSAGEFAAALRYGKLASGCRMDAESSLDLAMVQSCTSMVTRYHAAVGPLKDAVRIHGQDAPDKAVMALTFTSLLLIEMWAPAEAEDLLAQAQGLLPRASAESRELHHEVLLANEAFNGRGSRIRTLPEDHTSQNADYHGGVMSLVRARTLSHLGQHDESRHLLDQVLGNVSIVSSMWHRIALSFAVENEILAGNPEQAMTAFDALMPSLEQHHLQVPSMVLMRLWHFHAMDDVAGASRFLAQSRSEIPFSSIPALPSRAAAYAGSFALMRGEISYAVSQLQFAVRRPEAAHVPHLLRASGDLVEALAQQGNLSTAAKVLTDYEAQIGPRSNRWLRLSVGRARAVLGDPNRADANFEPVTRQWAPIDGNFELGRIKLAHGLQLLRTERTADAVDKLNAAAAEFNAAGAAGWAERCRGLVARSGTESPAFTERTEHRMLETLTSDERIIVERVLSGKRNKDIAEEVHVSLRTVEVRLTSVYRKFGARSRSHLAAMLTSSR